MSHPIISIDVKTAKEDNWREWERESLECLASEDFLNNMRLLTLPPVYGRPKKLFEDKELGKRWTDSSRSLPERLRFIAQRFVGQCQINGFNINVQTHIGANALPYMLGRAANLHIPEAAARQYAEKSDNFWLLLLVWSAQFFNAIKYSSIPRQYVRENRNLDHFRGRLDVRRHIKANVANAARFYCAYRHLVADNTINRAILHILKNARRLEHGQLLKDAAQYAGYFETLGVRDECPLPEELDKIAYSRSQEVYRPLMATSGIILRRLHASPWQGGEGAGAGFFIDMAELWETYLWNVLGRGLESAGYKVESPNAGEKIYLLQGWAREIRPDFIIRNSGGKPLMVLDAKYKRYAEFGKTDSGDSGEGEGWKSVNNCVSRADLYQMVAYMHHYGRPNEKLCGIFTAPVEQGNLGAGSLSEDLHSFVGNKLHKIGLVNLDIDLAERDKSKLEENEKSYCGRILKILQEIEAQENIPHAVNE